jgi:hypothetical protein
LSAFCYLDTIECEEVRGGNEVLLEFREKAHIFVGWKSGEDSGEVCHGGIWDGDGDGDGVVGGAEI